jgi:hypothetical protein
MCILRSVEFCGINFTGAMPGPHSRVHGDASGDTAERVRVRVRVGGGGGAVKCESREQGF